MAQAGFPLPEARVLRYLGLPEVQVVPTILANLLVDGGGRALS
ncbi:hypothetical protein [Xanthobacter autotrophicus]|nr:hypothetical protein [Xanthobacter autotrophicus]